MDDDLRVSLRRRSSPTGREESRSAYLKSESDARENTRIQNVYSGKASRVLRVLLRKPRTWNLTTLGNELTSETRVNPFVSAESDVRRGTFEISLGSISKALSTLEQELWIRRRKSAIVIPEPIRLLSQWAGKYKERYRWRLRGSFTCTNPFGAELRSVTESLNRIAPDQFAFRGAAAAWLRAPFVDIDKIDLFVNSPETGMRTRSRPDCKDRSGLASATPTTTTHVTRSLNI